MLASRTRPNWKEQFGRVLVEAMASGVVAVGSDSGEIPHVIGPAGLTFPEGDAAALADALRRLQADPALRAEFEMPNPRFGEHVPVDEVAGALDAAFGSMATAVERRLMIR